MFSPHLVQEAIQPFMEGDQISRLGSREEETEFKEDDEGDDECDSQRMCDR